MKRETHNKIVVAGIFCITAVSSLLGIFLPGVLLHSPDNLKENQVQNVQDSYYMASNTAMARNNSKRLKTSEKLQLISGKWESTILEADKYEMIFDEHEVVQMARDKLGEMYQLGLYQSNFLDEYGNWYTWETQCIKAVDATFKSYTAYYWVINLSRYDGTEKHTVYILEDGTLFYARGWYKEKINVTDMANAYDVEETGSRATDINPDQTSLSDWVCYPDADTSDMKWKALSFKTDEDGEYSIVQAYTNNEYLYSYAPYLED